MSQKRSSGGLLLPWTSVERRPRGPPPVKMTLRSCSLIWSDHRATAALSQEPQVRALLQKTPWFPRPSKARDSSPGSSRWEGCMRSRKAEQPPLSLGVTMSLDCLTACTMLPGASPSPSSYSRTQICINTLFLG